MFNNSLTAVTDVDGFIVDLLVIDQKALELAASILQATKSLLDKPTRTLYDYLIFMQQI